MKITTKVIVAGKFLRANLDLLKFASESSHLRASRFAREMANFPAENIRHPQQVS